MEVDAIKQAIQSLCSSESAVKLVYLFGSHAWGKADEESDIDIAILLDPDLDKKQRWEMRLHLIGVFAEALDVSDDIIDLVILQDVPPLLRYNATVYGGVCVYESSGSDRAAFELKVEQEWDDESYYLKRENDIILGKLFTNPIV